MRTMARTVVAGLALMGVAEIAFRGADATFYAWYLLFLFWIAALFIRFAQAAISAFKTAFVIGSDEHVSFPEFERRMAALQQGGKKSGSDAHSRANNCASEQGCSDEIFDDFRVDPIIREDDPFGWFLGD